MGNGGSINMFITVEDLDIDQLSFKCSFCGEMQFCFTDMPIVPDCIGCGKKLNPHPYHLYFSQVYRKRYHKKELANDKK